MLLYFENVFGLFILKIRNFLSSFHLSFVIYKFIFLLLFIVSKSYIFINKNLINNAIIQTTFHWRYESNIIKRFSLRELRFLARGTFLCNREFQQNSLLHKKAWRKLFRLIKEAQTGFEPVDTGVADHCLTTWLLRHYEIVEKSFSDFSVTPTGIEPVLPPWKGGVLTAWPRGHQLPERGSNLQQLG